MQVVKTIYNHPGSVLLNSFLSAGLGRTGTFIALDICLEQLKKLNAVNIPHVVNYIRQQRMKLVQTVVWKGCDICNLSWLLSVCPSIHLIFPSSIQLSVHLSFICLSVGSLVCLSIGIFIHPTVYLSISVMSVCLSLCLFVCPSFHPSVHQSVCLPVCISFHLPIYLYFHLLIHLTICQFVHH